MAISEGDIYALCEAGRSWKCPRCGCATRQYPALSRVRDTSSRNYPSICSDCGDDEAFQHVLEGTAPTPVNDWPVRRGLRSLEHDFGHRPRIHRNEAQDAATRGIQFGIYWDGRLEEWLIAATATEDPDPELPNVQVQAWSFPTRRLLDEYLASVTKRPEHQVRALLRVLLFEARTFGFDAETFDSALDSGRILELEETSEYFRRLPRAAFSNADAHPGVRWVIDLLPDAPGRAALVVDSYLRTHQDTLPQGRKDGLADAIDIIKAYYISNSTAPWREALNSIEPREFEYLVAHLYSAMGFDVTVTPPRSDGGRDLIARTTHRGGKQKLLIECKRYRRPVVGVKEARALLGAVSHERANGGVLVTTGRCTRGVHALAEDNDRVDYIDGERLVHLLNEHLGPGGYSG
ncbi:restriction endonuclease [Nocardia jinanensis]|uniref:restriction endonuclease n=1 Tax=Nocardia jinanensis TaxID=382504 RepID=UPI00166A110E|nr:restriction endonuclease [Nocardia jinanensis]